MIHFRPDRRDCQAEDALGTSLRPCADIHKALADAETAAKERTTDTLLHAVHLTARRAAIELRRNRPAQAVALLERAIPFERGYPDVIYLRGRAYLQMADGHAAAAEFRKIVEQKVLGWGARYPQAYVGFARAAAQTTATQV